MKSQFNRRYILRGTGAPIALPALESIGFRRFASAASTAPATPSKRCVFLSIGFGVTQETWFPDREKTGSDYKLSEGLAPLARHQSDITVVQGCSNEFTNEAHWGSTFWLIRRSGRVVDDLVEFCDVMPTLCEVAGAELPSNYPGDGSSIVPVLHDNAGARKKEWIYIWYRGQVMVRNRQHSLLAKTDGSDATLTRYKGPFDGKKIADSALSKSERAVREKFEATLARLAMTRLSSVRKEDRPKPNKAKK